MNMLQLFLYTYIRAYILKLLRGQGMSQIHLDTVFHALMSKIWYALCAWSDFLTHTRKGMINAFLRRMYKYHFVDAIVNDMDKKSFKTLLFADHCLHPLLPPVKSNPRGLRPRDHNLQLPLCNYNFRRNSSIILSLYRFK